MRASQIENVLLDENESHARERNAEISETIAAPPFSLPSRHIGHRAADCLSNPVMYRHCDAEMALRSNGASASFGSPRKYRAGIAFEERT